MDTYNFQKFTSRSKIINASVKFLNGNLFIVVANDTISPCLKELNYTNYNTFTAEGIRDQTIQLVDEKAKDNGDIILKMNNNSTIKEFFYIYKGTLYRYHEEYECIFSEISDKYYYIDFEIMGDECKLITKDNFNDIYVFDLECQKEFFSIEELEAKDIKYSLANVGLFGASFNKPTIKKDVRLYDVRNSKKTHISLIRHPVQVDKFEFANYQPYLAVIDEETEDEITVYDIRKPEKIYKKIIYENLFIHNMAWISLNNTNSWDNLLCYSYTTEKLRIDFGIFRDESYFIDLVTPSEKEGSFKYLSNLGNKMILAVFDNQLIVYDFGNNIKGTDNTIYIN